MTDYHKHETSAEVYAVIWARHRDELRAFGSFSDPEGSSPYGNGTPTMETSWCLPKSDFPLIEIRTTWDKETDAERRSNKRINEKHQYWLCLPIKERD